MTDRTRLDHLSSCYGIALAPESRDTIPIFTLYFVGKPGGEVELKDRYGVP